MPNIKPVWKMGNSLEKRAEHKPKRKRKKKKTSKQIKCEEKSKRFAAMSPEDQEKHRNKNKKRFLEKLARQEARLEQQRLDKLEIQQQWEQLGK